MTDEMHAADMFRAAVAPQAVAPTGSNGSVNAVEDVFYVFKLADFGFSDSDGHSFAGVYVTTDPTRGVLGFDGAAIEADSFIAAADIAAGLFFYEAGQNASGANFASFTFQVVDSTAEYDLSPNTLTIHVAPVNDAPVYRNFNSGSASSFNEGQTTPLFLDFMHNGLIEDVDSTDFAGGFLRVSITLGGTPVQDKLGIDGSGTVTVSGTAAGSTVSVGGVAIGTIAAGGTGISEDLLVNFNAAATPERVQALVRALTYFNLATDNPTQTTRVATISISDGDGPQLAPVSLTIGIQGFNDAPILSSPTQAQLFYSPGQPLVGLWQGVTMVDPDDQANFAGGIISMSAGAGGSVIELMGSRFAVQNFAGMPAIFDTTTGQQIGQLSAFGGMVQVFNLTSAATAAVVNELIRSFGFRTQGADPSLGDFQASLTFSDGHTMFGGSLISNMVHQIVTVLSTSSLPVVDLNGNGPGINGIALYTENGDPVGIFGPGTPFVFGPSGGPLDRMTLILSDPMAADIVSWGTLPAGISVSIADTQFQRTFSFTGSAEPSVYQALLQNIRYSNSSDAPFSQRNFQVSVQSGGIASAPAFSQIYITAVDDLGTARDDYFFVGSTGQFNSSLAFDNGFGPDIDPDGSIELISVNGTPNLHNWISLPSGGKIWVGAVGQFSFDPNNAYSAPAVESFTYTLRGGSTATATVFVTTPGSAAIVGTAGADTLRGTPGPDVLRGLAGDDAYFVDNAGDVVIEVANEGYDVIYAGVSYALAGDSFVEVLATIDNTASTPLNLIGNELANYVTGNAGANILDGGAGPDQLWGRGGDDSYYADAGDDVVEYDGDGYDILYARSSYALGIGQSIEVLATIDNTATTAINLAGNAFSNYIVGNAGANTLDGGGGDDQLWGREGDDSYIADMNDIVLEYAGQGSDILYATASYILAAGLSIETLATADNNATTAINLTGNELDNYVTGNAGANTLDGGTGSDLLWGRGGDDSYFADGNDVVRENAGQGSDIVYARGSFVLGAGVSVEILGTVDNNAATAIDLTGNELANYVTGNAGANVLDGGLGADRLHGRGGADTFAFTSALGGGNVDQLLDFVTGIDRIALDDAIFAGIGRRGGFNANAFFAGSAAQDGNDRIVYNRATGQLFYDADGSGAGAAVLFAILSGTPSLTASDFQVI